MRKSTFVSMNVKKKSAENSGVFSNEVRDRKLGNL